MVKVSKEYVEAMRADEELKKLYRQYILEPFFEQVFEYLDEKARETVTPDTQGA